MKLFTAKQTRDADEYAIHTLGISGAALMEAAAEHIVRAALTPRGGGADAISVAAICGTGNNGGDGIAAAAILARRGVAVRAFLVGDRAKMTEDARAMERRLIQAGGSLESFDDIGDYAPQCDVIIDAILGVGQRGAPRGDALRAIQLINAAHAKVVAADIPSGVLADTGETPTEAVRADVTVALSTAKPGHFVTPGRLHRGRLRVRDIGVPPEVLDAADCRVFAAVRGDVAVPRRARDTHKGDYGRVLIVAGSVGYTGAPKIAARAATRAGAGLVFLGVPEAIYDIQAATLDGELVFPLPCDARGIVDAAAKDKVLEKLARCDAALVGPGLGRSDGADAIVTGIIRASRAPLILDADGINAIAGHIDILDEATCPVILTPHDGEFERLGGDLSAGRLRAATDFAQRHRCVLILKGHTTITATPDGEAYINTTGSPAIAKGGSGDALAGIMLALLGQGFPVTDSAVAAVYLHGMAGDLAAARLGEYAVTMSDLLDSLASSFKMLAER